MAVVVSINWDGITSEQYDKTMKKMDLEGNPPPGLTLYVASFDEHGAHITDVWETAEDFQAFGGSRLAPVLGEVGVTGMPPTVILPAHYVLIP